MKDDAESRCKQVAAMLREWADDLRREPGTVDRRAVALTLGGHAYRLDPPESIADIVWEMRGIATSFDQQESDIRHLHVTTSQGNTIRALADRLERAAERERR